MYLAQEFKNKFVSAAEMILISNRQLGISHITDGHLYSF